MRSWGGEGPSDGQKDVPHLQPALEGHFALWMFSGAGACPGTASHEGEEQLIKANVHGGTCRGTFSPSHKILHLQMM